MEKLKTFIKKLLIIIISIITLIALSGISTSSTNAIGFGESNENRMLKEQYGVLTTKLSEMESYLAEIQTFDNSLYAQMLGVDFDTTDYSKYFNTEISFTLRSDDSIFSKVNERAFYAAEMLATHLTKLQETSDLFKNNKNAINYYPTISPIKTKDFICVSSPFGFREHPIKGDVHYHEGIDISANPGVKVYSTAQGCVVSITYSKYDYGNRIVIQHAYGFETLYAHLDKIMVKRGQWVAKNQLIGTVGNTGFSTGPHLHYEVHKNNQPQDPLGYFYVSIGEEFLAAN